MTPRTLIHLGHIGFPLTIAITSLAQADSITLAGTRHHDVYISESASLYYISDPDTGVTTSIPKDDPALGLIDISDDDMRAELLARYRETRARLRLLEIDLPRSSPFRSTPLTFDSTVSAREPADDAVSAARSHGSTPLFVLRGEPRASSPATYTRAPVRTNQFASAGGRSIGGGERRGGQFGEGPVTSGAGRGSTGGISGRSGGVAGGRGGNPGSAGGQRTGFSNISELFATVDDASVGESPNPITRR